MYYRKINNPRIILLGQLATANSSNRSMKRNLLPSLLLLKNFSSRNDSTNTTTQSSNRTNDRTNYNNSNNYHHTRQQQKHERTAYAMGAVVIFVFGLSYASVPLYKAFCQMTGFGGTTQRPDDITATTVKPVEGGRILRINFNGTVHSNLPWSFKPTQRDVKVIPGETALAFYTVHNKSDKAMTGVATYNVHPPKAGLYFNKVQCFCFEEQRIGPNEEIDMPVFFFIDPDFLKDPAMESVNYITLSYTFFKTGEEENNEDVLNVTSGMKKQIAPASNV